MTHPNRNCLMALFCMIVLASCAYDTPPTPPAEPENKTIEQIRAEALAKIDKEACTADGGTIRPDGMMGIPACVRPYADAEKQCNDGSQCLGRCMAADEITDFDGPPGTAEGLCERTDSPFGCYGTIDNGVVSSFICVD